MILHHFTNFTITLQTSFYSHLNLTNFDALQYQPCPLHNDQYLLLNVTVTQLWDFYVNNPLHSWPFQTLDKIHSRMLIFWFFHCKMHLDLKLPCQLRSLCNFSFPQIDGKSQKWPISIFYYYIYRKRFFKFSRIS